MWNSRTSLAPVGYAQILPSVTLEFLGSVSSTMGRFFVPGDVTATAEPLINSRLRLDVADVVGEGVGVHRPVVDPDLAAGVEPGERVLHPVLVVAIREVL